jgi:hypothetical protein
VSRVVREVVGMAAAYLRRERVVTTVDYLEA